MPRSSAKDMATVPLIGDAVVPGRATGELLAANVGISFWGGVDAVSGTVIDCHHPLHGQSIAGKILAIPNGRGSCTGSQVVLELLLAGQAPAAILMRRPDEIIALGVIVAEELFGRSLPVVSLGEEGFAGVICAKPTSAFVSFKDASHDSIIGIRGEYGTSGSLNDWSNFVFGRTCAANVSLSSETTVRAGRTFAAQTPHTSLPGVLRSFSRLLRPSHR